MFSFIDGIVPRKAEGTGYFILKFLLWGFSPLQLPGYISGSFTGDLVLCPMDDCEHPHLYLLGTGRASQETTISDSCQQALVGICLVTGFGGCLWSGSTGGGSL